MDNKRTLDKDSLLVIGKVGKAKGVKGWIKCRSFTDYPADLVDYYTDWILRDLKGNLTEWEVDSWRGDENGNEFEAKLKGCDDRNLAEKLTNMDICVPRDELPEPEEEGVYYWVDIMGFEVRNQADGKILGRMTGVMEQPGADLIVVEAEKVEVQEVEEGKDSAASESKPSGDVLSKGRSQAPGKKGGAGRKRGPKPKATLIPWVWGKFVLDVDMEAKTILVDWLDFE